MIISGVKGSQPCWPIRVVPRLVNSFNKRWPKSSRGLGEIIKISFEEIPRSLALFSPSASGLLEITQAISKSSNPDFAALIISAMVVPPPEIKIANRGFINYDHSSFLADKVVLIKFKSTELVKPSRFRSDLFPQIELSWVFVSFLINEKSITLIIPS